MTSPRIRPVDRVNGRGSRQHTPRQSLVAALLFTAAIGLTWLGSADVPIDTRNSAFWYRTLREIPGLTDVCGDFT
jgi:hypothetical protein